MDVIPPQILRTVRRNIDKAIKRFNKALDDPANSSQAKLEEEAIVKVTVCEQLRLVIRFNKKKMPDAFISYWESFGCGNRAGGVP